ncbi:MAG: META domain-containing protein [Chloroflexi bacterium]|nr:META domain-containing protein [Chloroflexota bacterium]
MKKPHLLLIALFILALSACSPAKPDISGDWKLVSYGDAANPTPALPDVETTITFEDGQMSGNVGCNGFGGEYGLNGDQITFNGIMSTMMFCEETSTQEQGVLSVFSDNLALQIQVSGDSLTIASPDGASVVILARK